MFVPTSFEMSDPAALRSFMRTYSFAVLITRSQCGMSATHLPLLLDETQGPHGALFGHMARANSQWRDVLGEAFVIFSGPHAYISPTWYEADGTVPTWNYAALHAYGKFELIEDRAGLHDILTRTVSVYESRMPKPWSYDPADPNIDNMLKGIVGFRIEISRMEGKAKLNQNHPQARRRKVIAALESQSDDDSRAVAALMAASLQEADDTAPKGASINGVE